MGTHANDALNDTIDHEINYQSYKEYIKRIKED